MRCFMNSVVNQKVTHKVFGKGTVLFQDDSYVIIDFSGQEKKFPFPDAFERFIQLEDSVMQESVIQLLQAKKEEEEKKQREEAETRRLMEGRRVVELRPASIVKRKSDENNLIFKCNFCDGGKTENSIGFKGVCSDEQIRINIEEKHHSWCSNPDSPCFQYLNGKITRDELERMVEGGFVCYESRMLTAWRAEAGTNLEETGGHKRARRIQDAAANHLAVFTTRLPGDPEEDRIIFGAFITGHTLEGDESEAGYVEAKEDCTIELTPEEAKQMKFWNYYKNSNESTRWGTGLYRYVKDSVAAKILSDIVSLKKGTEKERAQKILDRFLELNRLK